MPTSLKKSLADHGCELTPIEFRHLLVVAKAATHPSMSDEDLTYTIVEANDYCDVVHSRTGCATLPRPFILKALVNVRKNSVKA